MARGKDAERGVTVLYHEHYAGLVRLAAFLVMDLATAEAIVQDAFIAVFAAWRTLPDRDAALCLLHRTVVTSSRVVPQPCSGPQPGSRSQLTSAAQADRETGASGGLLGPAIVAALTRLPARQREAIVLQYYAGLPDGQVAKAMGIHEDAVQRLAAQSAAALRGMLNTYPPAAAGG
jgi:DNA-directed RNA polymerase specialized sigma24 family protein